ncbi:MAG: hypothetical protein K2K54_05710 [Lachnospiraceae bacterium]|nr:hypothetical protein [Lachnospiraceae bacterium]
MEKTLQVINDYEKELIPVVDTVCAEILLVLPTVLVFVLCVGIFCAFIYGIKNL